MFSEDSTVTQPSPGTNQTRSPRSLNSHALPSGKTSSLPLRAFRKSPVFTAVALLSLALGIGANTAIFTLLDQVLLRLMPVKNPARTWCCSTWKDFITAATGAITRSPTRCIAICKANNSVFYRNVLPLEHRLQSGVQRADRTGARGTGFGRILSRAGRGRGGSAARLRRMTTAFPMATRWLC